MNGPARITGPTLTRSRLARFGGRNARLLKRREWCARNTEESAKNCSKYLKLVLDRASTVRDGSGAGDWIDGGGHSLKKERPDPAGEIE